VRKLLDFGECQTGTPAVVTLLESLKGQVEADKQTDIDSLIDEIQSSSKPSSDIDPAALPAIDDDELYVFISYARPDAAIAEQVEQVLIKHAPENIEAYRLTQIVRWSQPRYQLDNRFVNLTLLLDQGAAGFFPHQLLSGRVPAYPPGATRI
jgi:hypothetical protein